MESQQHVDLITFTGPIQVETLPPAILGDVHVYASLCVPHTITHTLHSHTNTISYKSKIFQQKNYNTSLA